MFGLYIKKRGWVKFVEYKKDFTNNLKCCRCAGDMHDEFIFKNKNELNSVIEKYPNIFKDLEYEYKEIPKHELIDKRVVPSRKNWVFSNPPFAVVEPYKQIHGYGSNYCELCDLKITSEEAHMDGICIHCVHELYNILSKIYDEFDDDIKSSWQRAKILDEI